MSDALAEVIVAQQREIAGLKADYLAVADAAGCLDGGEGHAPHALDVDSFVKHLREQERLVSEWIDHRYYGFSADGSCRACDGEGDHGEGVPCDECEGTGKSPKVVELEAALNAAADRGTLLALQASVRAKAAEESLAVAQATLADLQGRIIRARGPA